MNSTSAWSKKGSRGKLFNIPSSCAPFLPKRSELMTSINFSAIFYIFAVLNLFLLLSQQTSQAKSEREKQWKKVFDERPQMEWKRFLRTEKNVNGIYLSFWSKKLSAELEVCEVVAGTLRKVISAKPIRSHVNDKKIERRSKPLLDKSSKSLKTC